VHVQIRMFPKLDQQAQGIADTRFGRAEPEQSHWDYDLRNVVDERVEKTGAKAREPIHLLDGMVPGVSPPKQLILMLRAMNPIDDEIHDEQGHNDLDRAGQALQKLDRPSQPGRREAAHPASDPVSADTINGQREGE